MAEHRPDSERKHGVKVENRFLKNTGDTKTQAKSGYPPSRQEKHRLAEIRGKTASPKMGPKSKIVI